MHPRFPAPSPSYIYHFLLPLLPIPFPSLPPTLSLSLSPSSVFAPTLFSLFFSHILLSVLSMSFYLLSHSFSLTPHLISASLLPLPSFFSITSPYPLFISFLLSLSPIVYLLLAHLPIPPLRVGNRCCNKVVCFISCQLHPVSLGTPKLPLHIILRSPSWIKIYFLFPLTGFWWQLFSISSFIVHIWPKPIT